MKYLLMKIATKMGAEQIALEDIDDGFKKNFNFSIYDMSPLPGLNALNVPVFYSQIKGDSTIELKDLQEIYDATKVRDKKLHWIDWENHNDRFHGYQYWYTFPNKMI